MQSSISLKRRLTKK